MNQILSRTGANGRKISLWFGDLTEARVDAIVNAANERLDHGGGVAGHIVRKGGPGIQVESSLIGGCKPGGAVLTGAGWLPACWVVHTVGPMGASDPRNDQVLVDAIWNSLVLAQRIGCRHIAFPAVSTGIFGFPKRRGAELMLFAFEQFAAQHPQGPLLDIRVLLASAESLSVFHSVFSSPEGGDGPEPASPAALAREAELEKLEAEMRAAHRDGWDGRKGGGAVVTTTAGSVVLSPSQAKAVSRHHRRKGKKGRGGHTGQTVPTMFAPVECGWCGDIGCMQCGRKPGSARPQHGPEGRQEARETASGPAGRPLRTAAEIGAEIAAETETRRGGEVSIPGGGKRAMTPEEVDRWQAGRKNWRSPAADREAVETQKSQAALDRAERAVRGELTRMDLQDLAAGDPGDDTWWEADDSAGGDVPPLPDAPPLAPPEAAGTKGDGDVTAA